MGVVRHDDPDYFENLTDVSLTYTRELGLEVGLNLGTVLMGDDPKTAPAAMLLQLPPNYTLERHGHNTHRVEVVVRGSIRLPDGQALGPGDVLTSRPGELYGPHTAGPEGALTVEVFASTAGLAPLPDDDGSSGAAMLKAIRAKTDKAQGVSPQ
jgi:hypothetical protein